jgi:pimeloyl-ACP methyl ester carboxylesterase
MVLVALTTVGVALVRADDPPPAAKSTAKKARKGGLLAPGGPKAKALGKEADPLTKATAKEVPVGSFHYAFKIMASDGQPLSANYYPSRLGTGSAVVMLVHERDRSIKDFEEKITDFQNRSLAEGLQKEGYAVLAVDLRGHGANVRRSLGGRDWQMMVADLQSAYIFLIDRHNRGELNLSRLGVVAVGEGANLVATWANLPGGAISSQGRTSDLGGLVLVSPMIDSKSQGLRLQPPILALAPRVPLCVLVGERDTASVDIVKSIKAAVTRVAKNKVEMFPSSLHGFKLLRLEPNVTSTIARFFEETIKAKPGEWEPRYNLDPVAYSDIRAVANLDDAAKTRDAARDEAK